MTGVQEITIGHITFGSGRVELTQPQIARVNCYDSSHYLYHQGAGES